MYLTENPEVTLKIEDSPLKENSQFREDLKREEQKMEKDLDSSLYPVISAGVEYKF